MLDFANEIEKVEIDISSSGNSTIISAPENGYIAIDHINFIPTSAVSVTLNDGDITPTYPLDAKQAVTLENTTRSTKGVITCKAKTAFIMSLDSAVQVSGFIRYRIVI